MHTQENNPLMFANAARVPFFLNTLSQHFSKEKGKDDDPLADKKILDIGCGGGLVTEEIAKHTKAKVIGTYRFASLQRYKRANAHYNTFLQA